MREDRWLAERLGRPVYWIEPGDDVSRLSGPAMYQAKVDADRVEEVSALERAGFSVVDVNLTLARAPGVVDAPDVAVEEARPDHADDVLRIAEQDYRVSRFHMDPDVPDEVARRIKRDWVQAYLDGERGERLLVAERGGR